MRRGGFLFLAAMNATDGFPPDRLIAAGAYAA